MSNTQGSVTGSKEASRTFETRPLTPVMGVEVMGFDFSRDLDEDAVGEIRRLADNHFLVLLRGQPLTEEQHVDFTSRLGVPIVPTEPAFSSRANPMILRLGNVDHDGTHLDADAPMTKYFETAEKWHSDGSYKQEPNYLTMLHSLEIPPEGGDTGFASTVAAWAALPEEKRELLRDKQMTHPYTPGTSKIKGLHAVDLKPAVHPVVRTLPNGIESLYISPFGGQILGLSQEESDRIIAELFDFTLQPQFTYTHHWRVADTLIWNNRGVIHQARPFNKQKYRRLLQRTETVRENDRATAAA